MRSSSTSRILAGQSHRECDCSHEDVKEKRRKEEKAESLLIYRAAEKQFVSKYLRSCCCTFSLGAAILRIPPHDSSPKRRLSLEVEVSKPATETLVNLSQNSDLAAQMIEMGVIKVTLDMLYRQGCDITGRLIYEKRQQQQKPKVYVP
ncbi:hypothetical protein Tco_0926899 [Tanacetum coccineum]|uniref:Uncharacterized protein n=1 Tax=Tanacetum coccineum TaxID=301880 RepID=A0ABQ5DB62_9ASTR